MARQNFVGLVISQGKMSKTVKVRVQGKVYDRRIDKEVITRKDFLVHDEGNICKEGDIVRIEHIPKRSKRKAFAIAEIKANKGQEFELYDSMARQRVQDEAKQRLEEFVKRKEEFQNTISQLDDLRRLDQLVIEAQKLATMQFDKVTTEGGVEQTSEEQQAKEKNIDQEQKFLLEEIEKIKQKYNIVSYPNTEEILPLKLDAVEKSVEEGELEKRMANIQHILTELMTDKYTWYREKVINEKGKGRTDLPKNTLKNILRKYVLNINNECPVPL